MKKIIIIVLIILLIGLGLFFFLGNGKEKVGDFFADNSFGSFFNIDPNSKNNNPPIENTNSTSSPINNVEGEYVPPILRQISFEPISGYTFYSTSTITQGTTTNSEGLEISKKIISTSTIFRFQERASGHIYDVHESKPLPEKMVNITNPKIYNAIFLKNKDKFLSQQPNFNNEQIITNLSSIIFSTSSEVSVEKRDLSSTINDFVYIAGIDKLIYSIKQDQKSTIYTSNTDRLNEKAIITIPFNDFLIENINSEEVLITTKASQATPGYSYVLNLKTSAFNKILGDIKGLLVKVSPNKKYYIFSQSEQTRPSARLYNNETKNLSLLTIDTVPEKCVFSEKKEEAYCFGSLIYKSATYPDDWYKGKVFNNESLYKINLSNGAVDVLYFFDENSPQFDIINPKVTTDNKFVLFENKYDLTLWSIDISKI